MIEVQPPNGSNEHISILKYIGTANAICITTNGFVKKDGRLIMGAGVAGAINKAYPNSDKSFGLSIIKHGHVCHVVGVLKGTHILSLPTKPDRLVANNIHDLLPKFAGQIGQMTPGWMFKSDIKLIIKSCKELEKLQKMYGWKTVILTKPGCGNGGLDWNIVRKEIKFLNDTFLILP